MEDAQLDPLQRARALAILDHMTRRELNGQSVGASGLGDWNVALMVVLAFVMPPMAVLSSAYATAWALRDHDRIRIRRYAPLLLVGLITTAGWIAGLHGELGWGFLSELVAAVLVLGLAGRSAAGSATRWLRARGRSQG
jgi:hypothetical protein